MSLLSLQNIEAHYGPVQVLFGVSLTVQEGQFVAFMGRNGMGKSTTTKVICRLLAHSAGRIGFGGADIGRLPPHKAARLGIGLVPEGRRCFANLTVRENLIAAARSGYWTEKRVGDLFPRLAERAGQSAGTLSGGEQQMLAIARALMTNPKVLILDEATEGLAPVVRAEIWTAIRRLKSETGLALLVVDKSLAELRKIADTCVLVERGQSVWAGKMSDLDERLVSRYLGV